MHLLVCKLANIPQAAVHLLSPLFLPGGLIPQHPGQMPHSFEAFSDFLHSVPPQAVILPPASSGCHAFALVSHTICSCLLPWGMVVLFLLVFWPYLCTEHPSGMQKLNIHSTPSLVALPPSWMGPWWTPEELCFSQTLFTATWPLRFI